MRILACDPGNMRSAFVVYDASSHGVVDKWLLPNSEAINKMRKRIAGSGVDVFVIEMLGNMGAQVGKTTFETAAWAGRFVEAACQLGCSYRMLYRTSIKTMLTNSSRSNDSHVRRAVMERFPMTGGGKDPAVGTKSNPGPLYGVSKDLWAALAVAIAYCDVKQEFERGDVKFGGTRVQPFVLEADSVEDTDRDSESD